MNFISNQCIESCPIGTSSHLNQCFFCHSDCSKCIGPNDYECVECMDK